MQEMWVRSFGQEDPMEKRMATHFSILAWEIPWTEDPGGLQFMGLQRVHTIQQLNKQQHNVYNQLNPPLVSICVVSTFFGYYKYAEMNFLAHISLCMGMIVLLLQSIWDI